MNAVASPFEDLLRPARNRSRRPDPWGLSDREHDAMSLVCKHGYRKVVAHEMGVCEQRVTQLVQSACRRMRVGSDIAAAVKYALWARRVS